MLNYQNSSIYNALDRLKPGFCPNFYFYGISTGLLEKTAIKIIQIIEQKRLIDFKGLMHSFSIIMPYYDSIDKAELFMKRLFDSYSIARDCYDLYKGIIIIECADEWSKFGYNKSLDLLTSFIGDHEEICFIILMPEKRTSKYRDSLFGEFTRNRLWLLYECKTLEIATCIDLFCEKAEKENFTVSAEAKEKLTSLLKNRTEFWTDNESTVNQLIKQIQLNKLVRPDLKKIIQTDDLIFVSGMSEGRDDATIGFNSRIR